MSFPTSFPNALPESLARMAYRSDWLLARVRQHPGFRSWVLVSIALALVSGCGGSNVPPAKNAGQKVTGKAQAKPGKKSPRKQAPKTDRGSAEEPADHLANPAADSEATNDPPAAPIHHIVRPDDTRPRRDDEALRKQGFTKLSSRRFVLYSDLPENEIEDLPEAIKQLYDVLEMYFGKLPLDRFDQSYQMTGYLMLDAERFRAAGILAEGPAQPHEGWYLGNEFWWNRQATPYYTRHLMLHEATHCFMHVMPAVDAFPWYVEGMAELFGTHFRDEKGSYRFGIFPDSSDRLPGWSRVTVLETEIAAGRLADVQQIVAYRFDDYAKLPPYAWSWAFCHFLNNHPRYKKPFQELARTVMDGGFEKTATELFRPYWTDLHDEWLLYVSQIQYGHDIERGAITFRNGTELIAPDAICKVTLAADKGWQSSGAKVVAGKKYRVTATGRCTLATTTKPWISEAQGISIRYFAGEPLGRLMGMVRPDRQGPATDRDVLKYLPLGPDTTFTAPHTGTLYLRVNDAWNQLSDNAGELAIQIQSGE